jgi:hypothetical protein
MKNDNKKKFLSRLKEETELNGLKYYPIDILDLGQELGLTEAESLEIADILVSSGIAEFTALGNSMIQLK